MLVTLYFVFSIIMKLNIEHYQLFLLLGILLWNFFSSATSSSIDAVSSRANLFQKINFPKLVVIVSSCLNSLISLGLNFLVFIIFMIIFRIKIKLISLLILLIIFELFILSLGISSILSILYAKFRDTKYIWDFILLIGFWISPIIYPLSSIPLELRRFYLLNPLARIITDARNILIYNYVPDTKQMLITFTICFISLSIGYYFFKKNEYLLSEKTLH